ncbi:portal protein [Pseudoalteromonas phage AL]|nr:portal protein [Pseudoalteromonas phage AL]
MWPFTKKLQTPYTPVANQVAMALKSLSLPQASPNWRQFAKMQEKWDTKTAINEGYNASAIVYAAIEKRAKLVAAVPWQAKRRKQDGTYEHVPNSPLQMLIDNPNTDQSFYEIMYEAEQSICLSGNCYLSEIRAGSRNQPMQLWHLPGQYMRIKPGTEKLVDYFEYTESNGKKRIEADDMIQLKMPNPNDRYFGQPVLMAASRAADVDRESADWQRYSLQNRGIADFSIELPEGTTQEQAESFQEKLAERQQSTANARRPIAGTFKVHEMGQSAKEMDFVESRKATWSELAAAFGVPLAALGFTESVNLANADAMNRMIYLDTIIPQLELYKRQLTLQLARDFGGEWILDYDLSSIPAMQANLGEKIDNAVKLYNMGVPFNTLDEKLGLNIGEIEGGDVPFMVAAETSDTEVVVDEESKAMIKAIAYGANK